jgi:peptidoglycan/xylan/chitin deacetylase (PgdA/CDA1 family)
VKAQVRTQTRAPGALMSWPAAAQPERLASSDVPMILMYHGVADVPEDPNRLFVPPPVFARQMAWLARCGLRGVSVATLLAAMRAGRHRRMVGITFDDGYTSILESALPLLKRHSFGATAFIISDRLDGSNDWDEGPAWRLLGADGVRALAAAGIEVGSHAATHARLAGLAPGQLAAEVAGSRLRLSALLGHDVQGFAYPYGCMDAAARLAVADAGYAYACAVQAPRAALGLLALPRVYVGQQDGAARLTAKRLLYRRYTAYQRRSR